MIRALFLLVAMVLVGLSPLPSAHAAAEQGQTQAAAPSDKEQYEQGMKERLGKVGAELDELKASIERKSAKLERKMKPYVAEAERKHKQALRKLEEVRNASQETWGRFSKDMDKAAKEVEQAFKRAFDKAAGQ